MRTGEMKELGAFWMKTSANGKKYLSGKIDGKPVVAFRNDYWTEDGNQPLYRVMESTERKSPDASKPVTETIDDLPF